MYGMRALADRKVTTLEAQDYFARVVTDTTSLRVMSAKVGNLRAMNRVTELHEGRGMGSALPAAQGTAWGLLNAVTQYVDHERRARNSEFRMDSAWFGQRAAVKQRALEVALASVA